MTNNDVDLLVIGAGANGSSVAYEATRRGLRVALLEAGDIAGGTSSRSTKLLHGGVRYLELAFKTFDLAQLRLVREALIEREHWLMQAPFLSRRLELVLPTKNAIDQSYFRVGLGLYDVMAGTRSIASSRMISEEQINEALPYLRKDLIGGVAYSDGQFDDARLNLLLALTAERANAIVKTRCKVVDLEMNKEGQISGAISEDLNNHQQRWKAKVVVNATGVSSDCLRKTVNTSLPNRILTSRGVHLVLKNNLCPQGIGLLIPKTDDGRVLFALPFHGRTLIGTTDTPCSNKEALTPSNEEKKYLLSHVKRWFPSLEQTDISSSWAGGRPLLSPLKETSQTSRVVREHEIEVLPCGLVSAMGGKWTTCRKIALDTLKGVEKVLGHKLPKPVAMPIIGADINPKRTIELLAKQKKELESLLPSTDQRNRQIDHLQSNYGLEAVQVIVKSTEKDREPLSELIPICRAEITHAITNEHAKTSTDILARRCRIAMVDNDESKRLLPDVQKALSKHSLPKEIIDLEKN